MKKLLIVASLIASACATGQRSDGDHLKSKLTQQEAQLRKSQILQVNYHVGIDLEIPHPSDKGKNKDKESKNKKAYFGGHTILKFTLKKDASKVSDTLFVDFTGGEILKLEINGKEQEEINYDGKRLSLDINKLSPTKENWVSIKYVRVYSGKSHGLYRFVDPKDKKVYVYTDLEPYYANKVFPCFDQPDLKASFKLTVFAPSHWKVISAAPVRKTRISKVLLQGKKRKIWEFRPTKKISTYVWALHAGPWARWSSKYRNIPLKLYARQSLAKHVDYKNWFKITKAGFKYYEKIFGMRYVFNKYDQLLVPNFNWSGMENVGAVTYNDARFVYYSKPSLEDKQWRASVILHELAHMWFGDLVTMDWWNGLWLNESFATFASTLAIENLQKPLGLMSGWNTLNSWSKRSAYFKDQLKTSHPIEVPVRDTDDAVSIFDAISYGKGASTLKQLYYFVGPKSFERGLKKYFKKHAYKNTKINDLVNAIGRASHRNLQDWKSLWLEKAGVNTLKVNWKCRKGVVSSFDLVQSGEHPVTGEAQALRPHKTEIGFYRLSGRGKGRYLKLRKTLPATYSGSLSILTPAFGSRCPHMVFPNFDDWDYVKMDLDSKSIKKIEGYLHTIKSELVRLMIWDTLSQMVLDGRYGADRFMDLALRELIFERSQQVSSRIMGSVFRHRANTQSMLQLLPDSMRLNYRMKLEAVLYKRFLRAKKGSSRQLTWFKHYTDVAISPAAKERMHAWLKLKTVRKLKLDQARRWDLIIHLSRLGHPQAKSLIISEATKDKSNLGENRAASAHAAWPDLDSKQYWLKQIYRQGDKEDLVPLSQAKAAMCCVSLMGQEQLLEDVDDTFFSEFASLVESKDQHYASKVSWSMRPSECSESHGDQAESLADKYSDDSKTLRNAFLDISQSNQRCLRARSFIKTEQDKVDAKGKEKGKNKNLP